MERRKLNFSRIIFIVSFIIFCISFYNIIIWISDKKRNEFLINSLQNTTIVEDVYDNMRTEVIQSEEVNNSYYWSYIKTNLMNVNFENLKQKNNETVGWLKVNGTNINYPFVQTNDNDFYLNHSFDKSKNNAGWVFLDYRNNINSFDKNTIIYAHGRKDSTMFGSLNYIIDNEWLDNPDNFLIKMSTETTNTLWQVFSIYIIETTNDYIRISFNDNKDFIDFSKKLLNRSVFNFNTSVNENDNILTLSTCYNSHEKMVVHAKLIKQELK